MADRTIKVLVPATSWDILSLSEAKLAMGMDPNDTTEDAQIQMFCDVASATVMRMCNRIFAQETIRESWSDSVNGRIFLSHWPVAEADITSIESPAGSVLDPAGYVVEEGSGKISGAWVGDQVVVTYTGGYVLPDEAPLPLKRAATLLVWQQKLQATIGAVGGIRMLSHHETRVMFHDPLKILQAALGASGTPMQQSVMAILSHYIRFEV